MARSMYVKIILTVMILLLSAGCDRSATPGVNSGSGNVSVSADRQQNLIESLRVDVSNYKSADGQPLLLMMGQKVIPKRPDNIDQLKMEDALYWYDLEYAGWNTEKINIPDSPKDGAIGKKVIVIINGDHPYLTAYGIGAKKIADAYQMEMRIYSPNWDLNTQNQLIDQAINSRPDLIILIPLDAKASIQQLRKINESGIPCIASNMLPYDEGLQYVIGWTGPDDWGQFRILARELAAKMGNKGGICFLRHSPGGSPFFSRTYGVITELYSIAKDIEILDLQAPGFEIEKSAEIVSGWITKYGSKLTAICVADDYAQLTGTIEACKKAGREDIIIIAAGNSKVGMDAVKAGDCFAVTYQSAESDGAYPLKMAADWFNGITVEPVRYLPKQIIKKDNVDLYLPAQW
ncbi:MAG: sugar ABC transporter substrate-binding protein [Saccharofermentanales bacterium]